MKYQMTPISSGTRLREDHNTFAGVITSYGATALVQGDELWIAPADGNEVKKGDKWLHVTHVNGNPVTQGWMAYIHKGVPYCDNFKDNTGETPPPPSEPPPSTATQYIVTVDEATQRVIVKRGDGKPMAGWTADIG